MKTQLIAGTYCKFDTAAKCKAAFERAKELGIAGFFIDADEKCLYVYEDDYNKTRVTAHDDPKYLEACGNKLIPTTEFLARMENKWEDAELTLPQAIAKLEVDKWRLQEEKYLFKQEKDWFCYCRLYEGIWCVEFFENDHYLEPRQFPTAPEQLNAAINACNTLNNAKPE